MVVGKENLQFIHYILDAWRLGQHPVRDPGILFDETGYPHPRVHQTLEPVYDLAVGNQYRTNLDRPVSVSGRKASGFKVDDDGGVVSHDESLLDIAGIFR
jgi:hypothetical protein